MSKSAVATKSSKSKKSGRSKRNQFQFLTWLTPRTLDHYVFLLSLAVIAMQAVFGFRSLGHPEHYAAYYVCVLYFSAPAIVVLMVMSMHAIAPEESLSTQIGKLILGLSAGIGLCIVCHFLGLRARAARGIGMLLFGGMAAANQKQYGDR